MTNLERVFAEGKRLRGPGQVARWRKSIQLRCAPLRVSVAMPPEQPPINLIRVFDFYVTLMFVISLVRRWDVYVNAIRILIGVHGRWPKLISRLTEHRSLILNR